MQRDGAGTASPWSCRKGSFSCSSEKVQLLKSSCTQTSHMHVSRFPEVELLANWSFHTKDNFRHTFNVKENFSDDANICCIWQLFTQSSIFNGLVQLTCRILRQLDKCLLLEISCISWISSHWLVCVCASLTLEVAEPCSRTLFVVHCSFAGAVFFCTVLAIWY